MSLWLRVGGGGVVRPAGWQDPREPGFDGRPVRVPSRTPAPIVKRNGQPYPSPQAALLGMRGRKLEGYEPVPIEGGFGLLPRIEPAPAPEPEPAPEPAPEPLAPEGQSSTPDEIKAAIAEVDPDPSDAKKEAGNYKKGHIKVAGMDIAIENPKGSERSGTDSDGTQWAVTMPASYGYIKRTEGADGDQVDVYIGEDLDAPSAFVVDQVDARTKEFDEVKAFVGFRSADEVVQTYDAAFNDGRGPERRSAITEVPLDDFRAWSRGEKTGQPFAASASTAISTPKFQRLGERSDVETPSGEMRTTTEFAVVDASELTASHSPGGQINPAYPSDLQPRDRARLASQSQVREMAAKLSPQRLDQSYTTDQGAPIVGPDGVVESGNGRIAAIRHAYRANQQQASDYRAYVSERARSLGVDISEMQTPVLVRIRTTDVPREAFAAASNVSVVAQMSTTEQARADAARVTDDMMARFLPSEVGNSVLAPSNRPFVKEFVERLPSSEHGTLMTGDGLPSKRLIDRIEAAVLWRAYEDERLLSQSVETAQDEMRNLHYGLQVAAAPFARARALGASEVADQVANAAELLAQVRRDPNVPNLDHLSSQETLFGSGPDPLAMKIAKSLDQRKRSGKQIGAYLREMAVATEEEAIAQDVERTQHSFIERPSRSPSDIIESASASREAQGETGELFAHQQRPEPTTETASRDPEEARRYVEEAIRPVVSEWGRHSPAVEVVGTVRDLPDHIQKRLPEGAEHAGIRGLYDRRSKRVYLFASQLGQQTPSQARKTVIHEAIGHYSIQQLMGDDFGSLAAAATELAGTSKLFGRYAKEVKDTYGPLDSPTMGSEILAHMTHDGVKHSLVTRTVAAIRRFMRGLGWQGPISHSEVIDIIARARRAIRGGGPAATEKATQEGVYFHKAKTPKSDTAAQKQKARFADNVRKRRFQPIDRMFRFLVAPVGGLDQAGNWKHSPKIRKHARRIIRDLRPAPDGPFQWLDGPLEKARHGWLNRYGTPDDFVTRERGMRTDQVRILRAGKELLDGLSKQGLRPEESKPLQEILEGKPASNERLQRMAAPIRTAIDDLGRELVDLGLLNEETWRTNLGSYLHRSYQQYEDESTGLTGWVRRRERRQFRRGLGGEELMRRGRSQRVAWRQLLRDVPTDQRAAAREARSWTVLVRRNKHGNVARRIFWPSNLAMSKAPEHSDSLGEWQLQILDGPKPRMVLRQDYSAEERELMGEIRDAPFNITRTYQHFAEDIAKGRFYKDIAENPDWFRAQKPTGEADRVVSSGDPSNWMNAMLRRDYSHADWVQVPDSVIPKSTTKRWGALAGGYIRAPIFRDMVELDRMQQASFWDDLVRLFRRSKTAWSPNVHFNNTIGNVILADLNDITFGDIADAVKEWRAGGELLQEAQEMGVFHAGFVSQDIQNAELHEALSGAVHDASKGASNMDRVVRFFKMLNEKSVKAYQVEDELFRLASYMRDRQDGVAAEDAASRAIDRFLNYDIRAPWPNVLRRTVLPFFSYTYAAVPSISRAIVEKPWKLAKMYSLGYGFQAASYAITDGDEERERSEQADVDRGLTWALLPRTLRTPLESSHGDPLYLDMTRILPGGGFLNNEFGQTGLPEFLLVGGPVAIASDLLANRAAWSGEDIVDRETDSNLEASQKRLAYLYRAMAPNLPIPGAGTWAGQKIEQAISDERDLFGRQYSLPLAMAGGIGIKLRPHDGEYQQMLRRFEHSRSVQAWHRRRTLLRRDYSRRRIDAEQYTQGLEEINMALRELSAG